MITSDQLSFLKIIVTFHFHNQSHHFRAEAMFSMKDSMGLSVDPWKDSLEDSQRTHSFPFV